MIKSLVSPREVVFRFPFQSKVDWAFQRRSAVKCGLYMRGPGDTVSPLLICKRATWLDLKQGDIRNSHTHLKSIVKAVYVWPFFSSLAAHTEARLGLVHHHQQTAVTALYPGNFIPLHTIHPSLKSAVYQIYLTSFSALSTCPPRTSIPSPTPTIITYLNYTPGKRRG